MLTPRAAEFAEAFGEGAMGNCEALVVDTPLDITLLLHLDGPLKPGLPFQMCGLSAGTFPMGILNPQTRNIQPRCLQGFAACFRFYPF